MYFSLLWHESSIFNPIMITSSSLWGRGLNFSFVNDKLRVPYQGIRAEKQGHYSFTKGLLFLNIHIWFWKSSVRTQMRKDSESRGYKTVLLCIFPFTSYTSLIRWIQLFEYGKLLTIIFHDFRWMLGLLCSQTLSFGSSLSRFLQSKITT